MNHVAQKTNRKVRPAAPAQPGHGHGVKLGLVIATLVLGLLIVLSLFKKPADRPSAEPPVVAAGPRAIPVRERRQSPTANGAQAVGTPAVARSGRVVPDASPVAVAPADSAAARQLIGQMAQVNLSSGGVTPAQAKQFSEGFRQLASEGAAAVPAIGEFLEKNQDLGFGEGGAKLAGVSSLRAGLLEALRQIGGPEALAVSRQVLQTTADPLEIALLGRQMEEAAPGQYRQEVVDAARQTLTDIAAGKVEVKEVAPLFQVLQTYGDAAVVEDVVKSMPQWNYYAAMTLAGLPSGEGIPALIQLTKASAAAGKSDSIFPMQMLAQVGAQYPEAAAALAELARQNQIPDRAWRRIADGLGGDQYQFARQLPDNTFAAENGPGLKTYHIVSGNQNFFSTPLSNVGSAADAAQRLALVDQLLAANPTPAAVEALKQVRGRLAGRMPGG